MSIKFQDITTSNNLDLTDKVLVSDGTSEHLVTIQTLLGRMSTLFQGLKTTTGTTITNDGYMYKMALDSDGVEVPFQDSGMSVYDGGVRISQAGSYKITASLYLSTTAGFNGVYIFYGTSFTDGPTADTGATELCGIIEDTQKASVKQVIGIVTDVPVGTIFYLVGRAMNNTSYAGSGWLLVERLA